MSLRLRKSYAKMICHVLDVYDEHRISVVEEMLGDMLDGAARSAVEPIYEAAIPSYCSLFTSEQFVSLCLGGEIDEHDGSGHPARNGKMASNVSVSPDAIKHDGEELPDGATHVAWFNK